MKGRYLTTQECEKLLEKIQSDNMPKNGLELLKASRNLEEAKDSFMLAKILPFRMFAETQYGKKEGYQEIIRQFQKIKERDYDRMVFGACQEKKEESLELAYFTAACADTLEFTSMEIYEHYRFLADLLKQTVRTLKNAGFFRRDSMEKLDKKTAELFGRAIAKGCRMNVLLCEKYEKIGRNFCENNG